MARLFLLLPLLLVAVCGDQTPLRWTVSLNDPPETRWAHIQSHYAESIQLLAKTYCSQYSTWLQKALAFILDLHFFTREVKTELKTLVQVTNITYAQAAFLNFMYEYNSYCTSVIVRMENGTILHGRNLDYPMPEIVRQTTAEVDVYQDGVLQYHMVWWPWYMGMHTAVKPGQFSISLNQRRVGSWLLNIGAMLFGYRGNCLAVRNALALDSYEAALSYLMKAKTVAGSYDIIASPTGGAIITRNRRSTTHYVELQQDAWYLVETNHDWWTPDPQGDNRTAVAEAYLNQVGQKDFTMESMYQLLSQVNVLNPYTIFTSLMVPATGYFSTVIRS